MADEKYTFEQARIRLEEIAAEVRKKDTSLEKSLDLLEEGVRLANICTELVDHTDMQASVTVPAAEGEVFAEDGESGSDAPAGVEVASVDQEEAEAGEPVEGFDEADDEVSEAADAEVDE